jgi:hypothetical protein
MSMLCCRSTCSDLRRRPVVSCGPLGPPSMCALHCVCLAPVCACDCAGGWASWGVWARLGFWASEGLCGPVLWLGQARCVVRFCGIVVGLWLVLCLTGVSLAHAAVALPTPCCLIHVTVLRSCYDTV